MLVNANARAHTRSRYERAKLYRLWRLGASWAWVRTEHLLALFTLAAAGSLLSLAPSPPNDLWWHLRVGALIAQTGAIPQHQIFAWSLPAEAPYVYGAWLGELLLFALNRLGGILLLDFARNALAMTTLALVAWETRRRVGSWRYSGLAVFVAAALMVNNVSVRPQMWAWLPFVSFITVLGRYADGRVGSRWLAALPVLMVFWVNVHGSFVLGLLLAGGYLAGELVRPLLLPASFDWARARWLALVAAAIGVATLVNPRGFGIIAYVARVADANGPVRLVTDEWRPPSPSSPSHIVFYGLVLGLFAVLTLQRRYPRPADMFLVAAFFWLAWSAQRDILWLGIFAAPMLAEGIAQLRPSAPPHTGRQRSVSLLTAATVGVFILVQPPWVQDVALPGNFANRMLPPPAPPLLTDETPMGATRYLEAHPGGRLFAELGYASYLIWADPGQPVFIDPRIEAFPLAMWKDYISISGGEEATMLLDRYGADRVLLSRALQPGLALALSESPIWHLEYEDSRAQAWQRG